MDNKKTKEIFQQTTPTYAELLREDNQDCISITPRESRQLKQIHQSLMTIEKKASGRIPARSDLTIKLLQKIRPPNFSLEMTIHLLILKWGKDVLEAEQ